MSTLTGKSTGNFVNFCRYSEFSEAKFVLEIHLLPQYCLHSETGSSLRPEQGIKVAEQGFWGKRTGNT